MKKKWLITALTCCLLLIAGICYSCSYNQQGTATLINTLDEESIPLDNNEDESEIVSTYPTSMPSEEKIYIYAHMCGAVENPGVYKLETGARIVDFIQACGGLTTDGDENYINQAETVADGQRIYVPTKAELETLAIDDYIAGNLDDADSEAELAVNINNASEKELMELPGIGEAKAKSIVKYRETQGKFDKVEDLMNIPGIKEGLFNQISSRIRVN
ncbi:MAG: ComEA family DNA-binding protein [Clostridiales bacterium]|nr:ComEA family DNA-binding protein [Clostridiales bacterium]